MDLGLRDWLLIIGPIVIVAILIHGYIRMRRARNPLKMDLDPEYLSKAGDEERVDTLQLLRAELPSGGARVVKPPEQGSLNLEDDVPVLMDPVTAPDAEGDQSPDHDTEPDAEPVPRPASDAGQSAARPSQLIVLHVFATGGTFNGQELLETLVNFGLKFGEMNIFHSYAKGSDRVEFSLVNAVEPGTFDLNDMGAIETPGISMFMELKQQEQPVEAFDRMVDTARRLAEELGGELRDGDRNTMTNQTIEHARQTVIDYKMRYG